MELTANQFVVEVDTSALKVKIVPPYPCNAHATVGEVFIGKDLVALEFLMSAIETGVLNMDPDKALELRMRSKYEREKLKPIASVFMPSDTTVSYARWWLRQRGLIKVDVEQMPSGNICLKCLARPEGR